MLPKKLIPFFKVLMTIIILSITIACDNFVQIGGVVFEANNDNLENGSIVIVNGIDVNKDDNSIQPLKDVTVRVFAEEEHDNQIILLQAISNEQGFFYCSRVYAPGSYPLYIVAKKEGYKPAKVKIIYKPDNDYEKLKIVLVPIKLKN
jgi:hypothetical protein